MPGTLTLSLDGIQVLNVAVDISQKLNLNAENAWVGFTGATGALDANQDILSWSFNSLDDIYQLSYAANMSAGDSKLNLTNGGTAGGNICAAALAL